MVKKNFIKKLTTTALLGGVIAGMLATNGVAANVEDHYWQLYQVLGDSGWHYISESRSKTNTSAAYVNLTGASNRQSGDTLCAIVTDQYGNSLQGRIGAQDIEEYNKGYSIHSMAYETIGNSPVKLGFYAPYRYTYSWSAWGLWSPDSTHDYN